MKIFISCIGIALLFLLTLHPTTVLVGLIFVYINISLILIYLGLDFLGLLFFIIYIGAILILFIFSIILIDFDSNFMSIHLSLWGLILIFFLFLLIIFHFFKKNEIPTLNVLDNLFFLISIQNNVSLFSLLYTNYSLNLIICSILLLISLIGGILLVNKKNNIKLTSESLLFLRKNNFIIFK